ncbi:Bacterial type II secretion system protein G [Planctomycetes bacterium Poly30]|uniref:Bacterial type II secretion system protein G n=1 Tax=Saltatorellus ferox TaxID=2528018 RepID=A0A518EYJ4_9BACT|nr:Bacterial type II secretion system protein G [Planctomycetes bacterium Poly30]
MTSRFSGLFAARTAPFALASAALSAVATAQDHAFHHPDHAAFALRCPDVAAAKLAWDRSAFVRFSRDEEFAAALRAVSEVVGTDPPEAVSSAWPSEWLEGVTSFSFSCTPLAGEGRDGSLFGYLADLSSSIPTPAREARWSPDLLESAYVRLVLDFESAEAAAAWAPRAHSLAESLGLEAIPEPTPPTRLELFGLEEGPTSIGRYKQRAGVDTVGIFSRISAANRVLLTLGPDLPPPSAAGAKGRALEIFDSSTEPVWFDLAIRDAACEHLPADLADAAPLLELASGLLDPLVALLLEGGRRTVSFKDGGFEVRGASVEPTWRFADVIGSTALVEGAARMIHPSARVAHVAALDADAAGAWMQALAERADAVEWLAEFGIDPARDVSAAFGSTIAIELMPLRGLATAPDVYLMATVADAEVLERMIEAGQRIVSRHGPDGSVVTRAGYRGAVLYTLQLWEDMGMIATLLNLRPTVVLHGSTVVLATSAASAKRWIRGQQDGRDMHAGLAAAGAPEGAGSIGFGDWAGVLADAYRHGRTLAPLAERFLGAGGGAELESVLEALPEASLLTRYFHPGTSWTRPLEGGATYRSASTSAGPAGLVTLAGVLGTFTAPLMANRLVEAQIASTRIRLFRISDELFNHMLENGGLPESLEALRSKAPELFDQGGALLDAWGRPFRYSPQEGGGFRVWSLGPNGEDEGGDGDDLLRAF